MTLTDADVGQALRRCALTPRSVAALFGTPIVGHLRRYRYILPATPATAALRLFVALVPVARDDAERGLGPAALAALRDRGLVADDADDPAAVRATHAIVPIGPSLAVIGADWPDDSSHHLIGCLPPARVGRWLDVATGVALAPLARPDRATAIVATDVDPAAVALARRGVALSGIRHVEVRAADLLAGAGADPAYDLITANLPIPAEAGLTDAGEGGFRHAPPGADLLARFVAAAPAHLAPGGTIVVHTWLGPPAAAIVDALAGEVCAVRYAPAGEPPFAIVRWRPGAPPAHHRGARVPTGEAPHLTWSDLDDAAA